MARHSRRQAESRTPGARHPSFWTTAAFFWMTAALVTGSLDPLRSDVSIGHKSTESAVP